MSEFRNLHDFIRDHKEGLKRADDVRQLWLVMPPDAAIGNLDEFLVKRRDYGEVRAADIYNNAYEDMQAKRCAAGFFSQMAAYVSAGGGIGLAAYEVPESARLWGLLPGLAGAVGAIGISFFSARRVAASAKIYERQFDPQNGAVNPDAPVDKVLARKADEFLRRYFDDEKFARSISYGEGLTKAWPLRIRRIVEDYNVQREEPVNPGNERKPIAGSDIIAGNLDRLGNPARWNKHKFYTYAALRLKELEGKHPVYEVTRGNFSDLAQCYDAAYRNMQDGREVFALLGLGGTIAAPIVTASVAAAEKDNAFSRFIFSHDQAVYDVALPFLAVALWNGMRMAGSAITNRRQHVRGKPGLNRDAPATGRISARAKTMADRHLQRIAGKFVP